jgi:hypothetical protein
MKATSNGALSLRGRRSLCAPSVGHTTAGTCCQLPALTTMAPVYYSFAEACAMLRISAHTLRPQHPGGQGPSLARRTAPGVSVARLSHPGAGRTDVT